MNPRQRRGVILMLLACIGAIAVFVTVLSYVSTVRQEVGDFRTVLELNQNVPANTGINAGMLRRTEVPKRWLNDEFIHDVSQLAGQVAVKDLKKGEYLSQGMLQDAPLLESGQREIAIPIDAETGVAGKVQPGSLVDIYATYQGTQDGQPNCAKRILTSVRVIDVGVQETVHNANGSNGVEAQDVVPVTFALTGEQSLELTLADGFATKVRLALIGPGSRAVPKVSQVCTDESGSKPTKGANP